MKELLRKHNLKVTPIRIEILEYMNSKKIVTIKNLLQNISSDKATIYRTIKILLEKDIIDETIVNNEVVYSIHNGHKHYIKCIKCNSVKEINICPFGEKYLDGYKLVHHSLTIDGICINCQNKKNS